MQNETFCVCGKSIMFFVYVCSVAKYFDSFDEELFRKVFLGLEYWRQNLGQNCQSWQHCVLSCPVTLLCNWRNKKCLECKQIRTSRILKNTSCVCIFNLNYICLLVWCAHTYVHYKFKATFFSRRKKKNQQIFFETLFVICKQ